MLPGTGCGQLLSALHVFGLEQKIELRDPRACAVAHFAVHFDGRISGVALGADGLPAGDIGLELMAPAGVGARREITGVVVSADGLPVPDALVSLFDGEANWRQVAIGIQTEADGRFASMR